MMSNNKKKWLDAKTGFSFVGSGLLIIQLQKNFHGLYF